MARKRPKMPRRLRIATYMASGFSCVECGWRIPEDAIASFDGRNAPRVHVRTDRRVLIRPSWSDKPDVQRVVEKQVYRELVVDHIIPLSRGGSFDDLANLQALCSSCNGKKWNHI